jgi:hypothetical protein
VVGVSAPLVIEPVRVACAPEVIELAEAVTLAARSVAVARNGREVAEGGMLVGLAVVVGGRAVGVGGSGVPVAVGTAVTASVAGRSVRVARACRPANTGVMVAVTFTA